MRLRLGENLADSWDESLIKRYHADQVLAFLRCENDHALRAAVAFVKFLNHKGLNSENYPFYMRLFQLENETVIHAFLGDGKILNSLIRMKRTSRLLRLCFELLGGFSRDVVYEKILETLLIILNQNYRNAASGFTIYPISMNELNYIGKYLDKGKPQTNKINRIILDILGDIGELTTKDTTEPAWLNVCTRANKIRNVFFDNRTSMNGIIPDNMLVQPVDQAG